MGIENRGVVLTSHKRIFEFLTISRASNAQRSQTWPLVDGQRSIRYTKFLPLVNFWAKLYSKIFQSLNIRLCTWMSAVVKPARPFCFRGSVQKRFARASRANFQNTHTKTLLLFIRQKIDNVAFME